MFLASSIAFHVQGLWCCGDSDDVACHSGAKRSADLETLSATTSTFSGSEVSSESSYQSVRVVRQSGPELQAIIRRVSARIAVESRR